MENGKSSWKYSETIKLLEKDNILFVWLSVVLVFLLVFNK